MRSNNPISNRGWETWRKNESGADLDFSVRIGIVLLILMFRSKRLPACRAPIALCSALCVASIGAAAGEPLLQQFSADIVSRDAAGAAMGLAARIYVANRQVRIELAGTNAGYFLIDGDAGSVLFVRPAQQVFMDAKQSSLLTQLFVPIDPADPCPQWQAAAITAGVLNATAVDWRCARIDAANEEQTCRHRIPRGIPGSEHEPTLGRSPPEISGEAAGCGRRNHRPRTHSKGGAAGDSVRGAAGVIVNSNRRL